MSRKNKAGRGAGAAVENPNPYSAPTAAPPPARPAGPVGEPRAASIHFGHLSGAFRVASRQQGTWILILILLFLVLAVVNGGVIIGLGILTAIVESALNGMNAPQFVFDGANLAMQGVTFLAASAVTALGIGGLFRVACKQVRGERIRIGDVSLPASRFGQTVLTVVLTEVFIAVSVFLVVLPFVLLSLALPQAASIALPASLVAALVAFAVVTCRLMLVLPLVVDGQLSAVDAIKKSWAALRGRTVAAIVFHALAAIFSVLGAILLGIGILLTLPVYYVAIAMVYHDFFLGEADYSS